MNHITSKCFLTVIIILCMSVFLPSCSKGKSDGPKPDIPGKTMTNPEVSMKVGISPEGAILPTISEIKWDFYEINSKPEASKEDKLYECRVKMKVIYNDNKRFVAQIQLLDINNFIVTTEQLKMNGLKGEKVDYSFNLYIEPELSRRITKARIVLETI